MGSFNEPQNNKSHSSNTGVSQQGGPFGKHTTYQIHKSVLRINKITFPNMLKIEMLTGL